MITGIAHLCFTTPDLDRVLGFYGALGLPVAFEFKRDDGARYGAYLRVGNRAFIEFFVGGPKPANAATYQHICLEVDDIVKTVAELRARGVEVSDPAMGSDHSWQARLADPDGNRVELHAYTPASWQAPHL